MLKTSWDARRTWTNTASKAKQSSWVPIFSLFVNIALTQTLDSPNHLRGRMLLVTAMNSISSSACREATVNQTHSHLWKPRTKWMHNCKPLIPACWELTGYLFPKYHHLPPFTNTTADSQTPNWFSIEGLKKKKRLNTITNDDLCNTVQSIYQKLSPKTS